MADAGRAPSSRRGQILCGAGQTGERARPHRHRRAQWLRQIQSRRGAALGDGRSLAQAAARRRDGRCDLWRVRPARTLAEVALTIDNSARDAPFAYNETTTIEVVRRIARGGGSAYRINGREARARRVQLLFSAD